MKTGMRIHVTSVLVDDQDKALAFYTQKLGFQKKHDIPLGQFKWLTVVSPDAPDGVELLLEPNQHPAAKAFQLAIYKDGIPATSFAVDDIHAEHKRLLDMGVKFQAAPAQAGPVWIAALDDTCGNWIQLVQK